MQVHEVANPLVAEVATVTSAPFTNKRAVAPSYVHTKCFRPPNGIAYETVDANCATSADPFQMTRCGVKEERFAALFTNWKPYRPDCRIWIGPAQPFAPVAVLTVPSHHTSALNVRRLNAGV